MEVERIGKEFHKRNCTIWTVTIFAINPLPTITIVFQSLEVNRYSNTIFLKIYIPVWKNKNAVLNLNQIILFALEITNVHLIK